MAIHTAAASRRAARHTQFMSAVGLILSLSLTSMASAADAPATGPAGEILPVVEKITFEGNRLIPGPELEKVIKLRQGSVLTGNAIAPDLAALQNYYRERGHNGVLVAPDPVQMTVKHFNLIFHVYEDGMAKVAMDDKGRPAYLQKYYGNTLICAHEGEDLCHAWMFADGTMVQIDPRGAHAAHWLLGPVQADGRVPICQYWDTGRIVMPPQMMTPVMASRWPAGNVCLTDNYKTSCRNYDDLTKESAEIQRKSRRDMAQRFQEEGVCYAHGAHEVGEAWYEYGTPLPGATQMDLEILIPGHQ